jgi:hypothetical protein
MPRPRLSREEATRRRREAALRGAATVRARRADQPPPIGDSIVPKGGELIARAQSMGREADLFYEAHLKRYGHKPAQWTVEQRQRLDRFLDGFIRPDGTPQPVPHRRRRHR